MQRVREVVNRMLNDLKKLGIISFDKGIITVHDLQFFTYRSRMRQLSITYLPDTIKKSRALMAEFVLRRDALRFFYLSNAKSDFCVS